MATIDFVQGSNKAPSLSEVLADAEEIVIVSAFVTEAGLDQVVAPILDGVDRGGTVTLIVGIDRGGIFSQGLAEAVGRLLQRCKGNLPWYVKALALASLSATRSWGLARPELPPIGRPGIFLAAIRKSRRWTMPVSVLTPSRLQTRRT